MPTLRPGRFARGFASAISILLALPLPVLAAETSAKPAASSSAAPALQDASRIAAVVNGDVIQRLRSQTLRQLVDEKLRVQEAQRRKIVIQDTQIAAAIKEIEARNNMQPGALRAKLASDGVSTRTLVDQIRAQLAWSQMLHDLASQQINVTDAEVADQQKLVAQQVGQTEYRLSEIFIPVDDPANSADAQRFAETVITELRAGAAFPVVAAQFSQNQSALEGGDLGWVQTNQLDPAIARIVPQMPTGAISNAVRVPGGFSVVQLQGKRQIGNEMATLVTLRQAFFAFSTLLTDPQNPTDQQRQVLAKARAVEGTVHNCEQMEALAKATNPPGRPENPGEIRVRQPATVPPVAGKHPAGQADGAADFPRRHRRDHRLQPGAEECG